MAATVAPAVSNFKATLCLPMLLTASRVAINSASVSDAPVALSFTSTLSAKLAMVSLREKGGVYCSPVRFHVFGAKVAHGGHVGGG
ncbi:MAG: hypothetical protein M3008_08760 [Chloroflexota bacterium]|nr:hypothetical protein [Chloroflexota bacterium]